MITNEIVLIIFAQLVALSSVAAGPDAPSIFAPTGDLDNDDPTLVVVVVLMLCLLSGIGCLAVTFIRGQNKILVDDGKVSSTRPSKRTCRAHPGWKGGGRERDSTYTHHDILLPDPKRAFVGFGTRGRRPGIRGQHPEQNVVFGHVPSVGHHEPSHRFHVAIIKLAAHAAGFIAAHVAACCG